MTMLTKLTRLSQCKRADRSTAIQRIGQSKFLSSSAKSDGVLSKRPISLTLYRNLLRWCASTSDDLPLSGFVPPVHMQPPQIDAASLKMLSDSLAKDGKATHSWIFPDTWIVDTDRLVCPIKTSADVRSLFQLVFRLNMDTKEMDVWKDQISIGFGTLKSLNEFSQELTQLEQKRQTKTDRDNVLFKIGQVVKCRTEGWRGVIVGWSKDDPNEKADPLNDKPNSLTKKRYGMDSTELVKYSIILDAGDAHIRFAKRREPAASAFSNLYQHEIVPVEDDSLCRVRNKLVSEHFTSYDSDRKCFIPNQLRAYQYPSDHQAPKEGSPNSSNEEANARYESIISSIQETAKSWKRLILDETSAPNDRNMKLLATLMNDLNKLSTGDVIPIKHKFDSSPLSKRHPAALHVETLHNIIVDIGDLLWQRRQTLESNVSTRFTLGDVVEHKMYKYRGVVVGFDATPSVDVSNWDGLQHIDQPHKYPFYHVAPDQNDCVEAFGGQRPSRYVCEANLDVSSKSDNRHLEVDLPLGWTQSNGKFIVPPDSQFKYIAEAKDDDESLRITERVLACLQEQITSFLVGCRDSSGTPEGTPDHDKNAIGTLSLDDLHWQLEEADSMHQASMVSDMIKEVWKANGNVDLRYDLDSAIGHMLSGEVHEALTRCYAIVLEDANYAEAWNKISTCEFMLGNLDASMNSAQKTISLIPKHYQAMNGLALVCTEKGEPTTAVGWFRKSLAIDPWSPVSSSFASCLDDLKVETNASDNDGTK